MDVAGSSTHKFVEITLGSGEDSIDFVLSFYCSDGFLMDDASDNIQATGVVYGQARLNTFVGVPDPENPCYTLYGHEHQFSP